MEKSKSAIQRELIERAFNYADQIKIVIAALKDLEIDNLAERLQQTNSALMETLCRLEDTNRKTEE